MTQEQIEQGTKVIADYMGWHLASPSMVIGQDRNGKMAMFYEIHNDWNKLHEVLENIVVSLDLASEDIRKDKIKVRFGNSNKMEAFKLMVDAIKILTK